jgi:hypothetical protein
LPCRSALLDAVAEGGYATRLAWRRNLKETKKGKGPKKRERQKEGYEGKILQNVNPLLSNLSVNNARFYATDS